MSNVRVVMNIKMDRAYWKYIFIDWLYQSFTAHQHQKGYTVPKQASPLDDDDDITESTKKTNVMVLQSENCTV